MRETAAFAKGLGMEIIPVVSVLGAAARLPEAQGTGAHGRIGGRLSAVSCTAKKIMFCPSKPEVMEFFEAYLSEIADIFPGRFLHVGLRRDMGNRPGLRLVQKTDAGRRDGSGDMAEICPRNPRDCRWEAWPQNDDVGRHD